MHPVEANRPAFADSTYTKAHYYYCVINKHFRVELFCGIMPLCARPTTDSLCGIY
jgi:hypothetical protein